MLLKRIVLRGNLIHKTLINLNIPLCLSSTTDREDAIISIPADRIRRKDYFRREIDLDISTKEKEFEQHHFPLNIVYDPIAAQMWMNDYQKHHNYDSDILQQYAQLIERVLHQNVN